MQRVILDLRLAIHFGLICTIAIESRKFVSDRLARDVSDSIDTNVNVEFDTPDISASFKVGDETYHLQGFKVRRPADSSELRWVSVGYPTLRSWPGTNDKFRCTQQQCSMRLEILTEKQRHVMFEAAKRKHASNSGLSVDSINILPLSHITCSVEIHRDGLFDDNPAKVVIYGSAHDFNRNPVQVHFDLPPGSAKRAIFIKSVINTTDPVFFKCTLNAGAKSVQVNRLTITSEQLQSVGLSDKLFGAGGSDTLVTREQAQRLSHEVASKLQITEEYEIDEHQFDEKFISQLLDGASFRPVDLDTVLTQISRYGLQMDKNDLSPDQIKRELSNVLEIATHGGKQHIIANRENSERLKTDSSSSGSDALEVGGSYGVFAGSVKASASFAEANSRDWGQSSKSVDDQLRELNNHSENHIKWEREGLKIIPKSLNVARISKATLTRSMTINRVRKRFVDAKFKRSYDIYVDESPATATALCNDDESWHHYNGSCYKIFDISMNWNAANSHCESHGAHLVTIGDRKENEFVLSIVSNITSCFWCWTWIWIGLRKDQQNHFAWIDTTNYSFVNWKDGEPSGREACVVLGVNSKKWHSMRCGATAYFMCEKEKNFYVHESPATATPCDTITMRGSGEFFSSPSYPSNYGNDQDCTYSLIALGGPGHVVKLVFDAFMTEKFDVVKVYDGSSVNAPLLRSISGSLESMPSFVSTGSQMTLRFKTDGSVVYSGWRAHFETIDVMTTRMPTTITTRMPTTTTTRMPTTTTTRMPTTITSAANALCDDKSWHHCNGNCYKLFRTNMNCDAAKSHCESHGAHLVTIGDQKENEFVTNLIGGENGLSVWIGLQKYQHNRFAWIDTTNYSFVNWKDGEPSGREACVVLGNGSKKWYLAPCDDTAHFMCEKEL